MKTLFTGQFLLRAETVVSTNSYALDWLREHELPEGALVTAHNQTGGRGQRGNSWESEAGKNLTLSFVFKPHFLPLTQQFDLTRAVSLAITDLLAQWLPATELRIKWPNDIMAGGKKICGILIENSVRDNQYQAAVTGIGLNVNQDHFQFAPQAVSMKTIAGKAFDLDAVLAVLCEMLEARYLQLRANGTKKIRDDYQQRLFRAGERAAFTAAGRRFEALVKGTTEQGLLLLEHDGQEKQYNFKELAWVLS